MNKKCLLLSLLMIMLFQNLAAAGPYSYIDYANRGDPKQQQQTLDPRYHELFVKSVYLGFYQFALLYGLTRLPEKVTKWDENQRKFSNFGSNWVKHVTSEPRIDHDPIAVNFIGHPWAGANYYVMARQTGLTPQEAFVYTIIESTFVWEYGIEAFAEVPSIQDLIITPSIGTIWGELKYRGVQHIIANNGYFLGSKPAGKVAIFILSPYNAIVEWTRDLFRGADKQPDIVANFSYAPVADSQNRSTKRNATSNRLMFNMRISF